MNPFTAHPSVRRRDLLQHLRFAFRFGAKMMAGGLAALVHSLLPFCFVTTASPHAATSWSAMRAASRGRTVRVVDVETMQPLDYHI